MRKVKNTIYATAGLSLLAVSNVALAASAGTTTAGMNSSNFYSSNNASALTTSTKDAPDIVSGWLVWITWFLFFAAVIMWLWWAYNILTAGGDEEKVKKGKDIIIRAVLWIIAVFSVSIIMNFVIKALFSNTATSLI